MSATFLFCWWCFKSSSCCYCCFCCCCCSSCCWWWWYCWTLNIILKCGYQGSVKGKVCIIVVTHLMTTSASTISTFSFRNSLPILKWAEILYKIRERIIRVLLCLTYWNLWILIIKQTLIFIPTTTYNNAKSESIIIDTAFQIKLSTFYGFRQDLCSYWYLIEFYSL